MTADSEDNLDARPALQQVLHYHEITKHHFQSYAQGPGSLDWATQPKPFRRYQGARLVSLEKVFVYRGDSTSAEVGAEFFLNSHAEAY